MSKFPQAVKTVAAVLVAGGVLGTTGCGTDLTKAPQKKAPMAIDVVGLRLADAEQKLQHAKLAWMFCTDDHRCPQYSNARQSTAGPNQRLSKRIVTSQDVKPGTDASEGLVLKLAGKQIDGGVLEMYKEEDSKRHQASSQSS